jgi:phosphoribosylglycinamide formyltransferase-1
MATTLESASRRVAVLASGTGTTFAALADASGAPRFNAKVVLLIVSRAEVPAAALARDRDVAHLVIDEKTIGTERADQEILKALLRYRVDLVVLAGYLRKIGPQTLKAFAGRMINTHPAPLPRFGGEGMYGEHVHRAVLESGVTASAATVHLVDSDYDSGPVIAERLVPIEAGDDIASLRERVQAAERDVLIQTVGGWTS